MTAPPTVTYHLDPATYDVLTDALEQHAAHLEQVTHESLFAPTAADREELHAEAARAEQLRDAIDSAQGAGHVTVALTPTTYGTLSAALASYHADQMQEAEEAIQERDDPEDGDPARQAAATADRLHTQAIEAAQPTVHHSR